MKTNNLTYSETIIKGNTRTKVNIRLNDECNNGHQDFAITCDIYERRSAKCLFFEIGGGAAHDHIIKLFPQFKIFIDLHLCDFDGAPMHAQANGFYHLSNEPHYLKGCYQFTDDEIRYFLTNCEDEKHFNYLLQKKGIVKRWEARAKKGIKLLEQLTEETFVNDSKRSQYTPLTAQEVEDFDQKIKEGYYTPEKVAERKEEARQARILKEVNTAKAKHEKSIKKANNELKVNLFMIDNSPSSNWIHYTHSNTVKFNWSYGDKITQEEFIDFINEVDYSELPEGTEFAIDNK